MMVLDEGTPSVPRPLWSNQFEGLAVMMSYTMGITIVLTFAFIVYISGGAVFLIPYLMGLVFLGFPMLVLQMTVGQFCSRSFLSSRSFAPITKGLGFTMLLTNLAVLIFYTYVHGFIARYLAVSMTSDLPWASCDHVWNTERCERYNSEEDSQQNSTMESDIYNNYYYYQYSPTTLTPAYEYFQMVNERSYRWDVLLGCLFMLILVFFALILGVRSLGKVAYVTLVLPCVLLLVLLIRAAILPGAAEGLRYLFYPNLWSLTSFHTWSLAFRTAFTQIGVEGGVFVCLASFNRFHNNILRDAFVVTTTSVLTCIITSLMIFCFIGFGAYARNVSVAEHADAGLALVCIQLLDIFLMIPASGFWSFLFLLLTLVLGFGTLCPTILNITTQISDELGLMKNLWRILLTLGVCAVVFVAEIFCCAWNQIWVFLDINTFMVSMFAALLEVISVGWFYGGHRLAADYKVMTGCKSFQLVCKILGLIMWCFLTPICLLVMIIGDAGFVEKLHWIFIVVFLAPIPAYGIYYAVRCGTRNGVCKVLQPAPEWRPALERHRQEVELKRPAHPGRAGVVLSAPSVMDVPMQTSYQPRA